ncbi:MAG TPA: AEC family transporter [Polyangiales bacterium]|nr:AEC family transporter [Polyangiales bacterium]
MCAAPLPGTMLPTLILVGLMFGAGSLLARTGIFPDTAADTLNRFVVYVALPALVLHAVPKLELEPGLIALVVVPWLTLAAGALACLGAARAFGWSRGVLGALLLCVPIGNTSFLGLPLLDALRGPEAVHYGIVYDQAGSFLILSTYGLVVLARYSGSTPPTAATLLLRVLSFPPFIALVLALLPIAWPEELDSVFDRVGATLVPLAMFAVGMRLRLRPPAERSALVAGLAIKMLLMPLCAVGIVRALDTRGLVAEVAVLEAAMPPMLTAASLAQLAGLAPELCAALAGYGIALAFVIVPLWAALQ